VILAQAIPPPSVSWTAIAPELALGLGAAIVLLVDVQWRPRTSRPLALTVALVLAVAAGLAALQWSVMADLGPDERAPFGGMIAVDGFTQLARIVLIAVTALAVATGWRLFERLGRRGAEGIALVLLSAAGFSLMAMSTHLVMMFMGLEIGSIALYVLAGITRERVDSDEAAIKYFLLGSVASAVFIYGVALTFAGTGQLDLVAQNAFLSSTVLLRPGVLLAGLALIIVGLAFKVTAAPFHSWAPDVYQGAPAGVVGFMASAAKIGGFMAMLRVLALGFPSLASTWRPVVAAVAALSMVLGAVLAVVQDDVRRILAYSGVAHAGYILTGVLAGSAGADGVWFYLTAYTTQLVGAFGVVAAVSGATGARSSLSAFAGLSRRQPLLATVFAVLLLAMGGLPLTSGFVAKFGVFRDAWQTGFEWLVIVAVLSSVIAFFFYLRIIVVMYMEEPAAETVPTPGMGTRLVLSLTAAATVLLGILPQGLLEFAGDALRR
jgi:NADH-quinone oxidoreductase subunit N